MSSTRSWCIIYFYIYMSPMFKLFGCIWYWMIEWTIFFRLWHSNPWTELMNNQNRACDYIIWWIACTSTKFFFCLILFCVFGTKNWCVHRLHLVTKWWHGRRITNQKPISDLRIIETVNIRWNNCHLKYGLEFFQ